MTEHETTPAWSPRGRLAVRPAGLAVVFLVCALGSYEWQLRSAYSEEKLAVHGVTNFGKVSSRLYRGAQPSDDGFRSLKRLGVDLVVSFTTGDASVADEARRVRALGMRHLSLPWSVTRQPTTAEVTTFLSLFDGESGPIVFAHCRQGADRTGVMVALYRVAHDHWSAARAISEMEAFRHFALFHPHLEAFVERFARSRSGDFGRKGPNELVARRGSGSFRPGGLSPSSPEERPGRV